MGKQDNQIHEVQIQFTEFLLCSANKSFYYVIYFHCVKFFMF